MNQLNNTNQPYLITCHNLEFKFSTYGSYKINLYTNIAVEAIIVIAICLINILLTVAIIRSKKSHAPSMLLILHNTIVDMLIGCSLACTWVPTLITVIYETHSCELFLSGITLAYFGGVVSMGNILLIAIDRYLAIFKPFFYKSKIKGNTKLYRKVIIALWIITATVIGLSFLTPNFMIFMICSAVLIIPTVSWTSYVYYKVFLAVRKLHQDTKARKMNSSEDQTQITKELNLAKVTALMIITMFICYTPFAVFSIIWLVKRDLFTNTIYAIILWVLTLLTTKSVITPLLSAITSPTIKKELKQLVFSDNAVTSNITDNQIQDITTR